jgi:hypothetical protein
MESRLNFISAEKEQRRREEVLCFFFAEAKKRTNCRREIVGDWHLFSGLNWLFSAKSK